MKTQPIKCPKCLVEGEKFFYKRGYFYTKHNYQPDVPRYTCIACGAKFSSHSDRSNRGQKKPGANAKVFMWICSGVTMKRVADNLGLHKRTVERKIKWLAEQARGYHEKEIESGQLKTSYVHFDEMEAYEHTPLKPLSIAIAVRPKTGQIIDMRVAEMNAKGHLAETSREKYGPREDTRKEACEAVMKTVASVAKDEISIACDSKKSYPGIIATALPKAKVNAVLSVRKKRGDKKHDPLFAVNNLCAKMRQDLAVLARKTMSTLKKAETLQNLCDIYIAYNNGYNIAQLSNRREITEPIIKKRQKPKRRSRAVGIGRK